MAASDLSGKTLPPGYAASYLEVLIDILGRHGADAVLRRSGVEAWIGQSQADLDQAPLDFVQSTAILRVLADTLGARGVRGLSRRMSATAFQRVLQPTAHVAAMHDPNFQAFPVERRIQSGLLGLARTLASISSVQVSTGEAAGGADVVVEVCPDCWGSSASAPACWLMHGLLTAALAWIAPESETEVEERSCRAQGAPSCAFSVRLGSAA
jgi:hypothetical protein